MIRWRMRLLLEEVGHGQSHRMVPEHAQLLVVFNKLVQRTMRDFEACHVGTGISEAQGKGMI